MNDNPSTQNPSLETLARQWGAQRIPFSECPDAWLETPGLERARRELNQNAALRSVLLLHGPNGVGKSALIARWLKGLDQRQFFPLLLTQATLSASSLLGALCLKLGKPPVYRRERQIQTIEEALDEIQGCVPVIVLDEAQNYSHGALEEVRLLLGLNLPAQPAFALTLIGDQYLLSSLKLRHHRPLFSRLGAQVSLKPWDHEQSHQALQKALRASGLSSQALDPAAAQQLVEAAAGLPRSLQLLARAAWLAAAQAQAQCILPEHVQGALELVPHLPGLHRAPAPSPPQEPAAS